MIAGFALLFIVVVLWLRPRRFTFYCGRHQGHFTSRYVYPRKCPVCDHDVKFLTYKDLEDGLVNVGDLAEISGGCPRFPGDEVELVGGYKAVVTPTPTGWYYKVIELPLWIRQQ